MASLSGILGQAAPSGGVWAILYTGPAGKDATVKMVVCNRGSVDLVRIAVCPGGAAVEPKHYFVYDMPIQANDSISSTGFTVGVGDVVRALSQNGNVSFTLLGIQEDS